jgi:uncharacterized protein YjbI with pentapeptide repeats
LNQSVAQLTMTKLTREQVEQIIKSAREQGTQPDLKDSNLFGVDLTGMNLGGVDLSGADLGAASLFRADLTPMVPSPADPSGSYISTDLSRAYLMGAELSEADLRFVNLSEANLSGADLSRADLRLATLHRANLSSANLNRANFLDADLSGADLSDVVLSGAVIHGATLHGASFNKALVEYTIFGNVDLSVVNGLDTVKHLGPSTIGIDTIYHSRGKIPEIFLRGCGLSDMQIEVAKLYNPDLTSEQVTNISDRIRVLYIAGPVQYYSCFISYSHKDDAFAQRLHTDLQQKGVRCWFAPEDMKIGAKIRPTIDHSIRIHDKLLLILSEHSINSTWVGKEVETAFEEEHKRKQTVLFPVRLDRAVMDTDLAWAADIRRTRHIGDFSQWKDHAAYQKAFERLLQDLKAEA